MSAKYLHNSFLPSGGMDYKPTNPSFTTSSPSARSPLTAPRRLPTSEHMSTSFNNNLSTQATPLSPPQSRSPSAENAPAAMVEDWRTYTANLRSQFKGEKAHMEADRARMEECMNEERELWELERSYWVAQVAELEATVDALRAQIRASVEKSVAIPSSQPLSTTSSSHGTLPRSAAHNSRKLSNSSHESHTSAQSVPQETGRDAHGAPFYAPAPQNPARTWASDANNLRIDELSISENDIKVTGKELTPSDFKQASPGSECLSPIPEASTPSIDISYIQPDLEGVLIKASAVDPTFAAKILSPVTSPKNVPARPEPIIIEEASISPDSAAQPLRPPLSRSTSSSEGRAIKTLEVVSAPENRRLTMNAGHTPNHSLTKLTWLKEEDGEATPKAAQPIIFKGAIDRRASLALSLVSVPDEDEEEANEDSGDKELSGPLGLVGDAAVDNPFLAALTEKLEEVKRTSEPGSPRGSETSADEEDDDDALEMPKLKIKPSMNFGRPMGKI